MEKEFLIITSVLSMGLSYGIAIIYAFEYLTSSIKKEYNKNLIWVFILSALIHIIVMANCFTLID